MMFQLLMFLAHFLIVAILLEWLLGMIKLLRVLMTTDWLHVVIYILKSALHSDLIEKKDTLHLLSKESLTLPVLKKYLLKR